jgi:para-nitrobenzyl esterase
MRALLVVALAALPLAAAIEEPVRVEGGLISGAPAWGWGVRVFKGVPYAAAPVGPLR